ncbi:MAG: nitrous oxide reductase family maturation protein NosD [Actinomycetota bacterium]
MRFSSVWLALVLWFVGQGAAVAAELLVKPGESIGAAIARAAAGDTVIVEKGRYEERLRIDKPLKLIGRQRPTISGGNQGDVIRITAPDVTIDGFIVTGSGDDLGAQNAGIYIQPGADRAAVKNCDIAYSLFGLWIQGVKDVEVRHNLIAGKRDRPSAQRGNGIQLYNTRGAQVVDNEISFTRDGLYVDISHHALFSHNRIHHVRYGAHYMNSYYNTWEYNDSHHNRGGLALMEVKNQVVRHNRAWANSDHGIMLRTIQDSVIEDNIAAGNDRGFFIYDAEYNTIRRNLVVGNHVGVHLWAGSTRNAVDGNDFIENRQQVRYVATKDELWGTKQGNYWSNYLGWDRDGDGMGDVPYEANDLVDRLSWRHPMMKLLMNSPAVQTLRLIARQFPLLRATSVVDRQPRMQPYHLDWRNWLGTERH